MNLNGTLGHFHFFSLFSRGQLLTLLHSERPKLHIILAFLSAIELKEKNWSKFFPLIVNLALIRYHHPGKQSESHKKCFSL